MRVLLLTGVLLVGCGGSVGSGAGAREGAAASGGGGACEADTTRLGASCWSAAGTHWRVQADGPGGVYRFDLALLGAGRVRATDHEGASPAIDEWTQDGSLLRIFLSDRFVEYRTRVTNGTVLIGEAINVRGQRWAFRADRDFGGGGCAPDEARLESACMTVAGTRWELDGQVVAFLAGGALAVGGAEEASGAWQQTSAALSFTLAEGEPAHVAEVASTSELSGTLEGSDGTWRATRLETIPPVMHE